MLGRNTFRAGILIAVIAATSISCGENEFTKPNLHNTVTAPGGVEQFLNSPQQESRELLIDGRVTDIEWNITGDPSIILMKGVSGRGGDYYISVRSLWTVDRFNRPDGLFFLLQWPDNSQDQLEEPLVTSVDVADDAGNLKFDCDTTNFLLDEMNWSRSDLQEDEVFIELFSDSTGAYPADAWRWGSATTDPCTPVNGTEFIGAVTDGDTLGQTTHPSAGYMEDLYDNGSGRVRDQGNWTYMLANHNPGSNVPLRVHGQGTRDSRMNRAKPVPYVLWETVSRTFTKCDYQNTIRLDDPGVRDKTWNPGDYMLSYRMSFPSESQLDVIARASYFMGKWSLEIRRDLTPRLPDLAGGLPGPPRPDDVGLTPGRNYVFRVTIVDGSTGKVSVSDLIPLYLKPRT
jgi:hypothetical protein